MAHAFSAEDAAAVFDGIAGPHDGDGDGKGVLFKLELADYCASNSVRWSAVQAALALHAKTTVKRDAFVAAAAAGKIDVFSGADHGLARRNSSRVGVNVAIGAGGMAPAPRRQLQLQLQRVLDGFEADARLSAEDVAGLTQMVPSLQGAIEEHHAVCVELFVTLGRFRAENSPADVAAGRGRHRVDRASLLAGWDGELGTTPDGRSLQNTFHAAQREARRILGHLDKAVQRVWGGLLEQHRRLASQLPTDSVRDLAPADGNATQHIPSAQFRSVAFLDRRDVKMTDLAHEMQRFLRRFLADVEADRFGSGWRAVRDAKRSGANQAAINAVIAAMAEADNDLGRAAGGVRALDGAGIIGRGAYGIYLRARATYAHESFSATVQAALAAELGVEAWDGIRVVACSNKGDARIAAKGKEYEVESLPEPCIACIKDWTRVSVEVPTIQVQLRVAAALAQCMAVVAVKNRLEDHATRDILLNVSLAEDGSGCDGAFVAEIQVHVAPILAIKSHTHKPYKVDRLNPSQCPCLGGLTQVGMWGAENMTRSSIRRMTSYTEC